MYNCLSWEEYIDLINIFIEETKKMNINWKLFRKSEELVYRVIKQYQGELDIGGFIFECIISDNNKYLTFYYRRNKVVQFYNSHNVEDSKKSKIIQVDYKAYGDQLENLSKELIKLIVGYFDKIKKLEEFKENEDYKLIRKYIEELK
jgi:hypothetical protein